MRYRMLGKTDMRVSLLGYGASPLGNEFGEADEAEGARAVHAAIDLGVNYFDVAPYYGRTLAEERLGRALEGKRNRVFLATKCGRYDTNAFDFSADRVRRSIDESLGRLRADYVDLLQLHDIEFGDRERIVGETLPALREIRGSGKCRYIGVTGLNLKMLRDVAERGAVDTILSYCRYNPMIADMDDLLTPFCKEKGIGLINASPLHMRLLSDKGAPDWHPAPSEVREAAARVVALCREAGVDAADVALRFCYDHPYVATTLAGMSKTRHVEANVKALDFEPDPELLRKIREAVAPVRNRVWQSGRPENRDYE